MYQIFQDKEDECVNVVLTPASISTEQSTPPSLQYEMS